MDLSFHYTPPGDADSDGNVDFEDFLTLSSNFGELAPDNAVWAEGDFDEDG